MNYWHIAVAAVIVALYEMVAHWFPWEMLLRKPLPRPAAYVIGVQGFIVPVLALLLMWKMYTVFWMVIILVSAAGTTVFGVRLADYIIARLLIAREMEERYAKEEAQGRASKARLDIQA